MFKTIAKQPNSPVYFTKKKAKLSGYILELSDYDHEFILFYKNRQKHKETKPQQTDSRQKALYRAKSRIIDYINSNSWQWLDDEGKRIMPIFLTLTFRENVQDLVFANYEFTKFIRRANYEFFGSKKSELKYVCVIEFQKRGAVHYHLIIFNLPYVNQIIDKLNSLWPHGYHKIESVKSERGTIAGYLAKYLTKGKLNDLLSARKCYFISRGLQKPIENSLEEVIGLVEHELAGKMPYHEYEKRLQINEKEQVKRARIYDLRLDSTAYNNITNLLTRYDY